MSALTLPLSVSRRGTEQSLAQTVFTPRRAAPATPGGNTPNMTRTPSTAMLRPSTATPSQRTLNLDPASKSNVSIVARVRPLNAAKETQNGIVIRDNVICFNGKTAGSATPRAAPQNVYIYDAVFGEMSSQDDLFDLAKERVLKSFMEGFHGTIFAYGQTGSGKTHTMFGQDDDLGLIPRSLQYMFANEPEGFQCRYSVSCLEIYNEEIFDCLVSNSNVAKGKLRIRERMLPNKESDVFVDGLTDEPITDADAAVTLIKQGFVNRHVSATRMNRESSRSHTVVVVTMQAERVDGRRKTVRTSKLHLIDLAGSERLDAVQTVGVALSETKNINLSLTTLGKVIRQIGDNCTRQRQEVVSYRDSQLTHLLSKSLVESKILLIATVSPAATHQSETEQTLRLADAMKNVRSRAQAHVTVEEDPVALRARIRELEQQLQTGAPMTAQARGSSLNSQEMHELCSEMRGWHTALIDQMDEQIGADRALLHARAFAAHRRSQFRAIVDACTEPIAQSSVLVYDTPRGDESSMSMESISCDDSDTPKTRRLRKMRALLSAHARDWDTTSSPGKWDGNQDEAGGSQSHQCENDRLIKQNTRLHAALLQFYRQFPTAFERVLNQESETSEVTKQRVEENQRLAQELAQTKLDLQNAQLELAAARLQIAQMSQQQIMSPKRVPTAAWVSPQPTNQIKADHRLSDLFASATKSSRFSAELLHPLSPVSGGGYDGSEPCSLSASMVDANASLMIGQPVVSAVCDDDEDVVSFPALKSRDSKTHSDVVHFHRSTSPAVLQPLPEDMIKQQSAVAKLTRAPSARESIQPGALPRTRSSTAQKSFAIDPSPGNSPSTSSAESLFLSKFQVPEPSIEPVLQAQPMIPGLASPAFRRAATLKLGVSASKIRPSTENSSHVANMRSTRNSQAPLEDLFAQLSG